WLPTGRPSIWALVVLRLERAGSGTIGPFARPTSTLYVAAAEDALQLSCTLVGPVVAAVRLKPGVPAAGAGPGVEPGAAAAGGLPGLVPGPVDPTAPALPATVAATGVSGMDTSTGVDWLYSCPPELTERTTKE